MRVFISYSRSDIEIAMRLKGSLESEAIEPLVDVFEVVVGEDWKKRLGNLIIKSEAVIFLLSSASIKSEICDWEINEAERLGKRILPAICHALDTALVPPRLRRLQFVHLSTNKEWQSGIPQLIQAIRFDASWVRDHTHFTEICDMWESSDRSLAHLLRGEAILQAERWAASRPSEAPTILTPCLNSLRHVANKR